MNGKTTPSSPAQHQDDAPVEAILQAAASVFAEHGYAGARVEAIARAAGINKAMLYYRVGAKAKLYELVVGTLFDRVASAVEQGRQVPGSPPRQLGAVLERVAELFRADPRLPRIMAWELASGGSNMPGAVVRHWGRILQSVAPLAVELGLDPVLTYFSMVGPMVFISLTEPIRRRFGGELPEHLRTAASAHAGDMAAFLAEMIRKAAGEAS